MKSLHRPETKGFKKFPVPKQWNPTNLEGSQIPHLGASATHATAYWHRHIPSLPDFDANCECLVVLTLNTHLRITGHYLVGVGKISGHLAIAREIFRFAILANSAAIILMHNHPNKILTPSAADIEMTQSIRNSSVVFGIDLLDHIIIAGSHHHSIV